jgi:hypothetical protein
MTLVSACGIVQAILRGLNDFASESNLLKRDSR